MLNNFSVKNNKLYIGNFSAEHLAEQFGTPLYVYDAKIIRSCYSELVKNISYTKMKIYYACKANANLEIIKLLKEQGACIETVSLGEIDVAFRAGYKSEDILFTCSNLSSDELAWLVKNNITVHLDSLTQLRWWGELKPHSSISLRVNQGIGAGHHTHTITGGVESKFGIEKEQLTEAKKIVNQYGLKIVGIHQHIGSGILDEKIFIQAIEKLLDTAMQFPDLEYIDFGGGFGIRYSLEEKSLDMSSLGGKITDRLNKFMKAYGKKLLVSFEPGRFLVAESGVLLATVVDIKRNSEKTFVGVNSGMNQMIRPAMYGVYQEIINASAVKGRKEKVSVVGNICESADFFAKDRLLSQFSEGDILAILDSGAYGYCMSSQYNLRSQPMEVLVDGTKVRAIRKVKGV